MASDDGDDSWFVTEAEKIEAMLEEALCFRSDISTGRGGPAARKKAPAAAPGRLYSELEALRAENAKLKSDAAVAEDEAASAAARIAELEAELRVSRGRTEEASLRAQKLKGDLRERIAAEASRIAELERGWKQRLASAKRTAEEERRAADDRWQSRLTSESEAAASRLTAERRAAVRERESLQSEWRSRLEEAKRRWAEERGRGDERRSALCVEIEELKEQLNAARLDYLRVSTAWKDA
eukprot:PLAT2207.1.p1 GENE.PLAT2207.1~~PLAT2207.1.p1  ORF type:complete len:240 (+),score=89.33 PLAT2207.1:133-852(+)